MLKLKNAFTLTETVITIVIIGILMMGMTIYLDGGSENSKIIEAEGCAATLDGEIQNYMYYALTSKKLKVGENYDQEVSPDSYHIYLIPSENPNNINCYRKNRLTQPYCDTIILSYYTGNGQNNIINNTHLYRILTSSKTCNSKVELAYYWSGDIKLISMDKGFSHSNSYNTTPFRVNQVNTHNSLRYGDIIILACLSPNCEKDAGKEIAKREIDARSQTIALKKCKFYQDDNPMLCETRED